MSARWHKVEVAPMLYVFGECVLDTQRSELCRAGRVSRLRHEVFQVLVYLLAHADRIVSKQELPTAHPDDLWSGLSLPGGRAGPPRGRRWGGRCRSPCLSQYPASTPPS